MALVKLDVEYTWRHHLPNPNIQKTTVMGVNFSDPVDAIGTFVVEVLRSAAEQGRVCRLLHPNSSGSSNTP